MITKFRVGQVVKFKQDGEIGEQNRKYLCSSSLQALWLVVYADYNWGEEIRHNTLIWRADYVGKGSSSMPVDPNYLQLVPEPQHPFNELYSFADKDFTHRRKKALQIQRRIRQEDKKFLEWEAKYEEEQREAAQSHKKLMNDLRQMIAQTKATNKQAQQVQAQGQPAATK